MFIINLSKDFSEYPGGRYFADGPYSGQKFREEHLVPALRKDETVLVNLDGAKGLPTSFLEEAFGGLVRQGFPKNELLKRVQVQTSESRLTRYPNVIFDYIRDAS